MNALSFFRSLWYLSGAFILVVVVLTLIFVVGVKGAFFLIIALFLFSIRLSVFCGGGYDSLLVVLGIKPGACGFDGCGTGVYGLFI